jgi:hypothetical protein
MDDFLKKNNFVWSSSDYNVYIKSKGTMEVMFLALYVDVLLIFSKDLQALKIVKENFYVTFEMKCRNPNPRLVTKARACKGAGQEEARESHLMFLGV